MMDDPTMTRETLSHSLKALNVELQQLHRRHFPLGLRITSRLQQADEFESEGDHEAAQIYRRQAKELAAQKASLQDFKQRLQTISDALSKDSVAWEAERDTFQSVVRTLGSLGAQVQSPQIQPLQQPQPQPIPHSQPQPQPLEHRDERTVTASTKLSVAGRIILDSRKNALDKGNKDKVRYEERLENTFAAFLDVVGDHPLSYYLPIHLQDFATVMVNSP
ncbi:MULTISPECIES: hypothetical protein [unclassified Agrobacterium]|uniref:hypothetical protein n=1 Tax=unclassified Agrobacterium TaxID=2632611 RepID=UPI0005517D8E|nr:MULTISPECIES: hypothetical protein [unclassified Agrobacterium]